MFSTQAKRYLRSLPPPIYRLVFLSYGMRYPRALAHPLPPISFRRVWVRSLDVCWVPSNNSSSQIYCLLPTKLLHVQINKSGSSNNSIAVRKSMILIYLEKIPLFLLSKFGISAMLGCHLAVNNAKFLDFGRFIKPLSIKLCLGR